MFANSLLTLIKSRALRISVLAALLLGQTLVVPAMSQDEPALVMGEELGCLAMNIYHEARSEETSGKLAVAAVTKNRVISNEYPSTICEVVWQAKQFSWTSLKVKYHVIDDADAWVESLRIAGLFMRGTPRSEAGDATHYHATRVKPSWSVDQRIVAQIGNHIFYDL